jgi:hypothetical protein
MVVIERLFVYAPHYFPRRQLDRSMGVPVHEVLDAGRAFLQELARFEPALLSGDVCAAIVTELARIEKVCAVARTRAAMRAVACGGHIGDGAASPREWLARQTGASSGQAQAEMDTVLLAEHIPPTRDALREGAISLTAGREITRTEVMAPGSADDLLAVALSEPLHVLKDKARTRRLASIDPEELHARQLEARRLRHWRDDLGMIRLEASLPPEDGVVVVHRLDAAADRIWRAQAERRSDDHQQRMADALVQVVSEGGKGKNRRSELVAVVDSRRFTDPDSTEGPSATSSAAGQSRCPWCVRSPRTPS